MTPVPRCFYCETVDPRPAYLHNGKVECTPCRDYRKGQR